MLLVLALVLLQGQPQKETPQDAIFRLTNEFRKSEKCEILKKNNILVKMAQDHAENMAKQEKLSHTLDDKTRQ